MRLNLFFFYFGGQLSRICLYKPLPITIPSFLLSLPFAHFRRRCPPSGAFLLVRSRACIVTRRCATLCVSVRLCASFRTRPCCRVRVPATRFLKRRGPTMEGGLRVWGPGRTVFLPYSNGHFFSGRLLAGILSSLTITRPGGGKCLHAPFFFLTVDINHNLIRSRYYPSVFLYPRLGFLTHLVLARVVTWEHIRPSQSKQEKPCSPVIRFIRWRVVAVVVVIRGLSFPLSLLTCFITHVMYYAEIKFCLAMPC